MADADPQEVFAELSKQAKVRIAFDNQNWPNGMPKISIDVDRQPFWLVMKALAEKNGVGPRRTTPTPPA